MNSGDTQWLQFLDNYDGIGLNTGADLFEKRLHVTGNVESVTYKTHSDWNEGDPTSHRDLTGAAKEQFDDFLNDSATVRLNESITLTIRVFIRRKNKVICI